MAIVDAAPVANLASNQLQVHGSPAEIDRLAESVRGEQPFDFEAILPTPRELYEGGSWQQTAIGQQFVGEFSAARGLDELREVAEQYGAHHLLNTYLLEGALPDRDHLTCWRDLAWGTKWQERDATVERPRPTTVCYEFCTAWAPPLPLLTHLSQRFPSLEFELTYEEVGMWLFGYQKLRAGDTLEEELVEQDAEPAIVLEFLTRRWPEQAEWFAESFEEELA